MSVSVRSYAIIGCQIPAKYLFTKEIEKHNHPVSKNAKFCP